MTAAGLRENTSILVTQPRRVAATALAHRVATEMQSPEPGKKGSQVGYVVRLDRAVSDDSKIVYCTVGILVRMLVCPQEEGDVDSSDAVPLANITHVVVDEVHERDVNTDFVLTLLRQVLNVNKQIRVVLMSATASTQMFARYFDKVGIESTVINIPGRSFPVNIKWISECERFAGSYVKGWSTKIEDDECKNKNLSPCAPAKIDCDFVKSLVVAIVKKQQADGKLHTTCKDGSRQNGAILVFLPGKSEIEALAKALYSDPLVGDRRLCNILKLHSTIPSGGQRAVFIPALEGMVKIVLATNIGKEGSLKPTPIRRSCSSHGCTSRGFSFSRDFHHDLRCL
jgi:HrpA-like RNA helicase